MKILKVLAIGITVGGMALAIHTEKAEAAEWSPRSAEQIKADISGNKYTIVWGDTLSAISEATNITVEKLAQWNSISNVDLIFAGNTISWDGNVATMENAQGDTISQAVIQETPADRVDPTKPIGGGGTDVTPPPGGDNGTGGGDNGSGGGETDPEEELYRVTPLGNSGMEFDTNIEAAEWGLAQTMDPESPWFGMRSTSKPLFWSNGEVLSYSVDFY